MRSTGRSTGPCLSWTASWSGTRCCATKPRRRRNRGRGRGGSSSSSRRRRRTRPGGRGRRGWTPTRCTTRSSAPSAPPRWPCSTGTRSITSSTSWPATAETRPSGSPPSTCVLLVRPWTCTHHPAALGSGVSPWPMLPLKSLVCACWNWTSSWKKLQCFVFFKHTKHLRCFCLVLPQAPILNSRSSLNLLSGSYLSSLL